MTASPGSSCSLSTGSAAKLLLLPPGALEGFQATLQIAVPGALGPDFASYFIHLLFTKTTDTFCDFLKNPPANAGDIRDLSSIFGSGRSPGEGHDNPLQYSCLENLRDMAGYSPLGHKRVGHD